MNNIYERFKALPRARKGATRVVIVEEQVLAELISDAQASEANLVSGQRALTLPVHMRPSRETIFALDDKVLIAHPDGRIVEAGDERPTPRLDRLVVERAPWLRDPHAP